MRECLVVEVTNRELLAMLRLDDDDDDERAGAVGREREQLPARQQLALGIKGADATDAQSPPAEGGLGDLRMSSAGSYLARVATWPDYRAAWDLFGNRSPGAAIDLAADRCPLSVCQPGSRAAPGSTSPVS
jgi:hypothetical protein